MTECPGSRLPSAPVSPGQASPMQALERLPSYTPDFLTCVEDEWQRWMHNGERGKQESKSGSCKRNLREACSGCCHHQVTAPGGWGSAPVANKHGGDHLCNVHLQRPHGLTRSGGRGVFALEILVPCQPWPLLGWLLGSALSSSELTFSAVLRFTLARCTAVSSI